MNHYWIVAVAFAVWLAYVRLIRLWLWAKPGATAVIEATTEDGFRLPLYYYAATGQARGAVLCVHGIFANARTFDVDAEHSLARHLAAQGFSVYAVSLRGIGPGGTKTHRVGRFRHDACFADYLERDLPAAAKAASAHSGFAKIHYVGHSMGGMLFYPFGAEHADVLGRAVVIGSIGRLHQPGPLDRLAWRCIRFLRFSGAFWLWPHVFAKQGARYVLAPLVGLFPFLAWRMVWRKNAEPRVDSRYLFAASANSPNLLLYDFGRMIIGGVFGHGALDYEKLARDNRVPTLVIAGGRDRLVGHRLVKAGYDNLGGEKEYLFLPEFGHCDMVYSRAAQAEVWPRIVAWLAKGLSSNN